MSVVVITNPALQELRSCLLHASRVLVGAANALEVEGSKKLAKIQKDALTTAKRAGQLRSTCLKLPEDQAKAELQKSLSKTWDMLTSIARRMLMNTEARRKLRHLIMRTLEEVGEYLVNKNTSKPTLG
jgi:vacuolar-type H+-ATPase subunit E/Vma4